MVPKRFDPARAHEFAARAGFLRRRGAHISPLRFSRHRLRFATIEPGKGGKSLPPVRKSAGALLPPQCAPSQRYNC
jgi:hypothetical protein